MRQARLEPRQADGRQRGGDRQRDLRSGHFLARGPYATSSPTVSPISWSSGSWKTMPTRSRTLPTVSRETTIPSIVTRGDGLVPVRPVVVGVAMEVPLALGEQRREMEQQRRLPGAVGPEQRDALARRRPRGGSKRARERRRDSDIPARSAHRRPDGSPAVTTIRPRARVARARAAPPARATARAAPRAIREKPRSVARRGDEAGPRRVTGPAGGRGAQHPRHLADDRRQADEHRVNDVDEALREPQRAKPAISPNGPRYVTGRQARRRGRERAREKRGADGDRRRSPPRTAPPAASRARPSGGAAPAVAPAAASPPRSNRSTRADASVTAPQTTQLEAGTGRPSIPAGAVAASATTASPAARTMPGSAVRIVVACGQRSADRAREPGGRGGSDDPRDDGAEGGEARPRIVRGGREPQ